MKKLLLILLALALVLTVTACKKKDDVSESGTEIITEDLADDSASGTSDTEMTEDTDEYIAEDTEDASESATESETTAETFSFDVEALDESEKQELIDEAAKEGIDVKFDDDGSATFTYGDGYEGKLGGEWPDNEHTKLIPEPEVGALISTVIEENTFMAMYGELTIDDAVTYAELVRENGFDAKVYSDDSMLEDGIFSFYGENTDGSFVTVDYMDSALVVSVTIE